LYYFKDSQQFSDIFLREKSQNRTSKGEYYIAPLYNALIQAGCTIYYEVIDPKHIEFCGTPDEYRHLVAKENVRSENE
jgi:hypothetical protein